MEQEEDIESPDSPVQSTRLRFKTSSVCIKMKFDALKENVNTDERNFVLVHEMYQCSKCYKIFNEESALTDHDCNLQKGSGSTCGNQNFSAKMMSRCKTRIKCYKYDCDKCDLSFTKKVLLRKHRFQIHKKKPREIECAPCNLKFNDRTSLLQHRKSHYLEKWFKCDQCDKRFAYGKLLDWHVRRQHLTPKPPAQCEICEKIFSTRRNLSRHRALHDLPNSKKFKCEVCDAGFPLKSYLKNHSVIHTDERPFMCEKCGKTFKTKARLKTHSVAHAPKIAVPITPGSKIKKYVPASYKYVCDKCGKRLSSPFTLKTHYFIHTGEKPYKCEVCSKAFRYKQLLTTHSYTHSNVKFACGECGKQYSNRGALYKHLKLHDDASAIPCEYCDMKFANNSALISHSVVHTKEKPYECDQCHKRYSQKGSLNKHPCSQSTAKSTAEILLNLISRKDDQT